MGRETATAVRPRQQHNTAAHSSHHRHRRAQAACVAGRRRGGPGPPGPGLGRSGRSGCAPTWLHCVAPSSRRHPAHHTRRNPQTAARLSASVWLARRRVREQSDAVRPARPRQLRRVRARSVVRARPSGPRALVRQFVRFELRVSQSWRAVPDLPHSTLSRSLPSRTTTRTPGLISTSRRS